MTSALIRSRVNGQLPFLRRPENRWWPMRILLDESLPHDLAALILDHHVSTVRDVGRFKAVVFEALGYKAHQDLSPRFRDK